MNKYKLLRFGRTYINNEGSFKITIIEGNRYTQYVCFGSHNNAFIGTFYLKSRIVPNDANWIEVLDV